VSSKHGDVASHCTITQNLPHCKKQASTEVPRCIVEYNLPPTSFLFAIDIQVTAEKPEFHNFFKDSDSFFGTWWTSFEGTTHPTFPIVLILLSHLQCRGLMVLLLSASALKHIPYLQKKNIWFYFSRLPYFYISCETMLATISKSM